MKSKYIIALSIIVFILLIMCIKTSKNINKKDTFITLNNDPELDGKMKFTYLNDKNYGKNIIDKYYTNDDTVFRGNKVVYHPYQLKRNTLFGIANYIGLSRINSDYLYNTYGVRL